VAAPTAPTIYQLADSLWVGQNFVSYQWYLDGSPSPGDTNFFVIVRQTGNYSVYVTDSFGCKVITQSIYATDPTGIFRNMQEQGIKIFPNPTADELWVMSYGLWDNSEKVTVEILNVLGEKVYSGKLQTTNSKLQTVLDISSLSKGFYILQLLTEDKQYQRQVIKQ
jgi:hypothetical protein